MTEYIVDIVIFFAQKNPSLLGFFAAMGVFRAVFKPIMLLLEKYVEATPSKSDDEKLEKLKANKHYKALVVVVDYLMSIKLPVKK
jgi:hypothetical protein